MNPIFQQMNGQNGKNNFFQQFQSFKNSFRGDPQQIIQQMLNSGRITQQQYDNAVKMANQFRQFIK